MLEITIRCYAELNDCLSAEQRFKAFPLSLPNSISIEELSTQLGLDPGTIDLILVNGHSQDLAYRIHHNDQIALYPVFESMNIGSITKIRPAPLRRPKFVLDVHLGKLARHLRMLGFDTLYEKDFTDELLIQISINQTRILLSRDKPLIESGMLTHAHFIMNINPHLQLIEVLDRFDLYSLANPFTRCIECNTLLRSISKESIASRIPVRVMNWCNEYQQCTRCDRIYWQGSHYQKMNAFVQDILKNNPSRSE